MTGICRAVTIGLRTRDIGLRTRDLRFENDYAL